VGAKALISGEVSSTYRRIYSHAIGILMLTGDETVAGPVRRIMAAAEQEPAAFEAVVAASDTDEHRGIGEEQHAAIQRATLALVNYGLQNPRGSH
jgi:hypothetical protein